MRLLEDDRVVNHGARLLADAIEQAAMIVAVEAGRRCGRRRACRSARSPNISGHTRADCSVVGASEPAASRSALGRAFTSGRRLRATQPVSPWPVFSASCWMSSESAPVAKRQYSVSCLLRVEEQGARRERHQVRQPRRDERHRVRHAQARAHRLRDLVERVDLAMRDRDVVEHRLP